MISKVQHNYEIFTNIGGSYTPTLLIFVNYGRGDVPQTNITLVDMTEDEDIINLNPHEEPNFLQWI